MRQSTLFTKTRKEAPSDEVSKNAKLLIRAGFIHKEMAGVYSFLPLGLRVLNNIVGVIRREMDALGGQEVFLTALQDKAVWQKTDRWDDAVVDNWFKTKFKKGGDAGLGFTHEEPVTALMREYIQSFRDLPIYPYQFQMKFRNEERAKSGIMRCREFLMKDLYSFSKTLSEHDAFYEKVKAAYVRIFERVGLGARTYLTFASGGTFSKYSHEFQTVCDAGEDTIFVDEKKRIAVNKEVLNDEVLAELGVARTDLVEKHAVEVGNIFSQGTRFTEALGLSFKDENGKAQPAIMGAYGIGPGRVMGTIVETLSDEKGLVWPAAVAPFAAHIILLNGEDKDARAQADELDAALEKKGIEALYDDRELRAGEKFADADLIGIPYRLTVSAKTATSKKVELRERAKGTDGLVSLSDAVSMLTTQHV